MRLTRLMSWGSSTVSPPLIGARYFRFKAWYDNQGVMVNATTMDMIMATGTFSAMGRIYGPIIPVMKNIGRNETMTASVAVISGGRISATASSTISRVARPCSAKCRAIFSTSTIGSSTSRPNDSISAKSVTRLIVKPKRRLTAKVRPKTTGMATATISASRHPRPMVSNPTTIKTATPSASTSSFTLSSAVRPLFRVITISMSSGTISFFSTSAAERTLCATRTAFDPFFLAMAIVTAGCAVDPGTVFAAPIMLPGDPSRVSKPRAGPQPCLTYCAASSGPSTMCATSLRKTGRSP